MSRYDLIPPFARATVEDLMRPGILSCHADARITEVADTMATHRIHAVVVTGIQTDAVPGDQTTTGLVTDVDLIRAAAAHPESLTARDIARTAAVTVEPARPLLDAARVMAQYGTAHLIVMRDAQPVGVLSGLDIAAAIAWGGGGWPAEA